jgi:hypothetical protein
MAHSRWQADVTPIRKDLTPLAVVDTMGEVVIDANWAPGVRSAAMALRRGLNSSRRNLDLRIGQGYDEERALQLASAEEALAVTRLMLRLGHGSRVPPEMGWEEVQLELRVHEEEGDASLSFFRALEAARSGDSMENALSKGGRLRSVDMARQQRNERIQMLSEALALLMEARQDPTISLPWDQPDRGRSGVSVRLSGGTRLKSLETQLGKMIEHMGGD